MVLSTHHQQHFNIVKFSYVVKNFYFLFSSDCWLTALLSSKFLQENVMSSCWNKSPHLLSALACLLLPAHLHQGFFTLSPHRNPSCQSWWWSISSPPLSSMKRSALGTTSSEAPTSWTSRTPHFPGPSPPGVVSAVSLFDCLSFLYPPLDHWPSSLPTLHSYWMASSIPWFQVDHLCANDSQIYVFILNLSWTPGSCLNASCIWPVEGPSAFTVFRSTCLEWAHHCHSNYWFLYFLTLWMVPLFTKVRNLEVRCFALSLTPPYNLQLYCPNISKATHPWPLHCQRLGPIIHYLPPESLQQFPSSSLTFTLSLFNSSSASDLSEGQILLQNCLCCPQAKIQTFYHGSQVTLLSEWH